MFDDYFIFHYHRYYLCILGLARQCCPILSLDQLRRAHVISNRVGYFLSSYFFVSFLACCSCIAMDPKSNRVSRKLIRMNTLDMIKPHGATNVKSANSLEEDSENSYANLLVIFIVPSSDKCLTISASFHLFFLIRFATASLFEVLVMQFDIFNCTPFWGS